MYIVGIPDKMSKRKVRACELCQFKADRQSNIDAHMVSIHASPENWPFLCPLCDVPMRTKRATETHLRKVHPGV